MTVYLNRRLTCGIVILNAHHELLLCHVTGQDHWDLPKGGMHFGETPLQTALRETREETGLALSAHGLIDLGRMDYRPKRDLHLFAALMPRFDVTGLRCAVKSTSSAAARRSPEMDAYGWSGFECIAELCVPKMATVLNRRLNLPRVLYQLSAQTGQTARVANRASASACVAEAAKSVSWSSPRLESP